MAADATSDTGPVETARKAIERPRFPLVWKLFGLTALLIVVVVLIAVGITIQRANQIASTTVNNSIAGAARLFKAFERQRLNQLALPAQLLGNESVFVAYVEKSLTGGPGAPAPTPSTATAPSSAPASAGANPGGSAPIDLASLADQLEQRRQSFGSDLLILLDDQGRVVFRTDQPAITSTAGEDLYEESPLVKHLVDDASLPYTAGVITLGSRLYHAAVAPVGAGANNVRRAYLLNALAIDDAFANRIAESTNAGVMFAPSPKAGGSGVVARSSNAPSIGMQQMTGVDAIFRTSKAIPPGNIQIDRSSYVMTGEPLLSGSQTVGAAVFLRSLDTELAPFRQIENALLLGGGAALLMAFILSWFIARRITRPIEQLAGVAQAVTAGDYDVQPNVARNDEVGILGRSFAKMITALRDKAELEELYAQMSARDQQRESAPHVHEAAMLQEGTVLVTDLRGLPATVGGGDAASVISIVAAAMKLQEKEVGRQEGLVRHVIGHRLISVFQGERGILHAIRAARAINEELGSRPEKMSIGVGIATGEFVTGSVDLAHDTGLAIVGNAPLLAMIFAWHAPTGYAYVSYETAQAAGGDILSGSAREQVVLRWLPQPLPVASMPLANLNTNVMRSIGAVTTGSAETMRVDGTVPGVTAPATTGRDLTPGILFASRYQIDSVIGRGGMGVVYKATDTQLDETVAIKTLPGDVMTRSPEELERFKREIRLARRITHRNVLRTYDYGEADGVYFISMEFVRGYTLSELMEEAAGNRMAPRVALGIARQICRGLEAAHEQTIIHRDIKPANVLIDAKGEVKLMDFGIARMAEATDGMTQAGLIVGTPHYMSPEQVQGKTLDPRSDVYAMGVVIYEMLAGRKPFTSSSLTGILTAHVTETPKPLIELRPEVGKQVNAIVMRCLAKDPKDRYSDAGKLLQELDSLQMPGSTAAAA